MRPARLAAALFAVTLLGCASPKATPGEVAGCGKDTDCKGERICESARCTNPPSPAATTGSASTPATPNESAVGNASLLVKVLINTEPDGATVTEDGLALCSTPCEILYKGADAISTREHTLTFARSGYGSVTRTLRPGDSPIRVKLIGSTPSVARQAAAGALPF